MNVLLNVSSVRKGGGQQVASNFLTQLAEHNGFGHQWVILAGKNTALAKLATELNLDTYFCEVGYLDRYYFELVELNKILKKNKIDIIYNYAPCFQYTSTPQVIRSVFSNLYFPEIDFWAGHSFKTRLKKKVIDHFRLKRTLFADGIVFENKAMLHRAQTLFKRKAEDLIYIAPSVTAFKEPVAVPVSGKSEAFHVLILSSWHPNKNIHMVPDVLKELETKGIKNVYFDLSLSENEAAVQPFLADCKAKGVYDRVRFLGTIPPERVRECYTNANAVLLLSKLECFSSNIIESWSFNRPLIIADEEWSRAICGDAALYVNRDSASAIAGAIEALVKDDQLSESMCQKGQAELTNYNSPYEKVTQQIDFLTKIYERNKK